MDRMKLIAALVVLCLASSVAAFLLPTAHGTLLSYVSIASAAVIAVLAVIRSEDHTSELQSPLVSRMPSSA